MKYIIDSNCFVTPHRSFCPTDVGISFWNKIQTLAKQGKIYSLDKVKEELYSNSDDLKKWLEATINDRFFIEFTQAHSIHKLATIIQWASTNEFYTERAKRKFLNMEKADIYLASFASVNPEEWTIVSMERSAPNSPGEIKLPDVCTQYNVRCIQLEDMFREIGETF